MTRRNTPHEGRRVGQAPRGRRAVAVRAAPQLEREADHVAATALATPPGGRAVVRITPTITAGWHEPASRPAPLPTALAEDLGRRLGADLSATRVHTDTAAAEAVARLGAQALTSGRDVYFAPGAWQPATAAGRELLLHELAHVLQQTGRRTAGGGLAATPATGSGDPQALRTSPIPAPSSAPPTLEEIARRHLDAHPDDRDMRSYVDGIVADLARDRTGTLTRLATEARDGATDATLIARHAFLLDVLKHGTQWEAAGVLLGRFPTMVSTFYAIDAFAHVPEDDDSWAFRVWSQHPRFADYGVGRFIDTILTYLLAATRDVPNLGLQRPFEEWAAEQRAEVDAPTGLIQAETYYAGVAAVERLDAIRLATIRRLARQVAPGVRPGRLGPVQRRAVAAHLMTWADEVAAGGRAGERPEVRYLLDAVVGAIRRVASFAHDFWSAVLRFETLRGTGGVDETFGDVRAAVGTFLERPEAQSFLGSLHDAARAFFTIDGDTVPSPAIYRQRARTLESATRTALYRHVDRPLLSGIGRVQQEPTLFVARGWLAFATFGFLDRATTGLDAVDDLDARVAHRIRAARRLHAIAVVLGHQPLIELTRRVLTAELPGQTTSQLALVSDWEEQSDVPISRLTEDFRPGHTPRGFAPLTIIDLYRFYRTLWMREERRRIEQRITDEGASLPLGSTTLLGRVRASMRGFPRPTRWQVSDAAWALRPDDRGRFGELVRDHPKTQRLLAAHEAFVVPTDDGGGVFLWTLPEPRELVDRIRQVDAFNRLIAAAAAGVSPAQVTEEAVAALRALDWGPWWERFRNAFDPETFAAAHRELAGALRTEYATATRELDRERRRASILERTQRVERQIAPLLAAYDRYDQFSFVGEGAERQLVYEIPGKVAEQVSALAAALLPEADNLAHLAATVLELAPTLRDKLSSAPRVDVIIDFRPLIQHAITQAAEHRSALRRVLPASEQADAWIDERTRSIRELERLFAERERNRQRQFGMEGVREPSGQWVIGIGRARPIPVGPRAEAFTIDGITWQVLEVLTPFTFHPAYGTEAAIVEVGGQPAAADTALLRVRIGGGQETRLHARDIDTLTRLSHAVSMEALVQQLQELAVLIEGFTELTMEALELIPGAGQVVMGARLAVAILQFVASGEFDEIVDTLLRDPVGAFEWLGEQVVSLFEPAILWEYLLFGDARFDVLRQEQRAPERTTRRGPARTTGERLARIARQLYNVGKRFLAATSGVQTRVRWRAESFQLFVLGHPLLARVLRFVADNLEVAVALTLRGIAAADELADLQQRWSEAVDDLPGKVVEIARQLETLELPEEIIPLGDVLDVVTDIVVSRLGVKYRIGLTVLLTLLELAGQRQQVFDAIAEAIPDEVDPNRVWRDQVRAPLAPRLTEARRELVVTMFDVLGRFEIFASSEQFRTAAAQAGSQVEGDVSIPTGELPEVEAFAPTAPPAGARVDLPEHDGRPLSPAVRRAAETRFGQDLGHVRLHPGSREPGQVGAHALTSGSHVYLAPGVTPASGHGTRVLHHELAHVLQQTGPRPRGATRDPTPVRGAPGRGLVVQPAREAAADRAATTGLADTARAEGVQPALPWDVIRRILDATTSTADIQRDAAQQAARTQRVPDAVRGRVGQFLDGELRPALGRIRAADCQRPFNAAGIPDAITRHLTTDADRRYWHKIEAAFDDVVRDSLTQPRRPRGGTAAGGSGREAPEPVLDVRRFADALARSIFGETGILLDVDVRSSGDDAPVRVRRVRVVYVHLPPIHGNSELWTRALDGVVPAAEQASLRPRIRAYLAGKGPSTGVWKPVHYGLRSSVIDDVRAALRAGDALAAGDLPAKRDYLAGDGPGSTRGHIGLRIGTYADANQRGPERESHHTTQFLLSEYFHHDSGEQPFPLLSQDEDAYPGVKTGSDGKPDHFQGGARLAVADLYANRGGRMPTILLARETHRSGRVHVNAGDDFPNQSLTQGQRIHAVFRGALPEAYKTAEGAGLDAFRTYRAQTTDLTVTTQTERAMKSTFGWMRGIMIPRLQDALATVEASYFNDLAEQKPTDERLSSSDMDRVWVRAKSNNDTVMAAWR